MKKVTVILLCLFSMIFQLEDAHAQYVGDSIIVYVDRSVEVKISLPDYANNQVIESAVNALDKFKTLIPSIEEELSDEAAEEVIYHVDSLLKVKPLDNEIIYLLNDDNVNNTGVRDQVIILGKQFKVFITTTNVTLLKTMDLIKCIQGVTPLLPAKGSWSKSLYYECVDGEVSPIESLTKNNLQNDFLEFSLGAGAGLIRNDWYADLSIGIGFGFHKKGELRHNPYISTNLIFDFDEEQKVQLNTFLNLGYGWNINKGGEEPEILSVEVGYLIAQNGDLFQDNTFKLGLNWLPIKGVTVSPQLFFTDSFNTIYPGIRVGFGF